MNCGRSIIETIIARGYHYCVAQNIVRERAMTKNQSEKEGSDAKRNGIGIQTED